MEILSQVKIKGIGGYVPENVITNNDLTYIVDTSDQWIRERTGIKERRRVAQDEGSADLALKAVEDLISQGYSIDDVDLIIVATMSPDNYTPSVSAQLQGKLGLSKNTMVIDINAACGGFVQGIQIANGLITVGQNRKAIIIGVETLTRLVNYEDRTTCILFGDGAGAILMERSSDIGLLSVNYGADGEAGNGLYCRNLKLREDDHKKIVQDGRSVYNFAIKTVPKGMKKLLDRSDYELEDLDWFIPHSANLRMIQFIAKILKLPIERVLESVTQFGNTSAATIPLALWLGKKEGKLKDGDLIATYGFGGGLNHAGALFRWYK